MRFPTGQLIAEWPLAVIVVLASAAMARAEPLHVRATVRRPVSLVQMSNVLLIGNRESGSISVLEAGSLSISDEVQVAKSIDDLIAVPRSQLLLAVDSASHELIQIVFRKDRRATESLAVAHRVPVARYPVSVVVMPAGELATVASRWSRRLTVLAIDGQSTPQATKVVDLPFAPGKQLALDNRHVLVADAFAGQLAIVNVRSAKILSRRELNGHNIRGLALSADGRQVHVTHQIMLSITATTRSRISWGGVVSNSLHALAVSDLLKPMPDSFCKPHSIYGRLYPLGEDGYAAGDPAGIASTEDGRTFVALSGIHEVCLKRKKSLDLRRVKTARRPMAVLFDEKTNRLFVAGTSGDSVSVHDGDTLKEMKRIPLGPPTKRNPRQLGEELFYDARLSLDGWYSCHSCHSDGHSTGRLNDNFSDHSFGTPKRILSLLGVADTKPWAWDGSQPSLEAQVESSIRQTMSGPGKGGPTVTEQNINALAEFLRSLPPAPSVTVARGEVDEKATRRGRQVFSAHGCAECHRPSTLTSPATFDVGLHDATGLKEFNPPSLRGLSQRGPYFHDNRAATLRELIDKHDHDGASSVSEPQKRDLLEFLKSL